MDTTISSLVQKRHKSALTTIFGKQGFLRMPFGIVQGPAYSTALMQKAFGQFNDFCFIHINDVLVHDSRENDHLQHLKIIFQRIREVGLKLKLSKFAFFKRHLQYLGHLISGEGIYPLKEKVEIILTLAPL